MIPQESHFYANFLRLIRVTSDLQGEQIMTAAEPKMHAQYPVHYKTVRVNNQDIFYREAGDEGAPAILLLHGFPTSSNMFRNLIPRLASSFRLVAPDYPGYGQSSMPDYKAFEYSFENLANIIDGFVESIGLSKYSMYVMDYGAPIGYRLALKHPERVEALIVQNGNAYEEGLLEFWDPIKKYWGDPTPENRAALEFLVVPKTTRWQCMFVSNMVLTTAATSVFALSKLRPALFRWLGVFTAGYSLWIGIVLLTS
jgi:pimeloyl-ACP methyl ester carboxylesterase